MDMTMNDNGTLSGNGAISVPSLRRGLIAQRNRVGAHTPAGRRCSTLIGQLKARASGRHGPDLDKKIVETLGEMAAFNAEERET
jgi:hypothetical protein